MERRIWTPSGDVSVGTDAGGAQGATLPEHGFDPREQAQRGSAEAGVHGAPTEEEMRAAMEQMRRIPPQQVIIEHAILLYNLAAVRLDPDGLPEARIAIDALAGLLEGAGEALGEAGVELREMLRQIQLAFVDAARPASGADGAGDQDGEGTGAGSGGAAEPRGDA